MESLTPKHLGRISHDEKDTAPAMEVAPSWCLNESSYVPIQIDKPRVAILALIALTHRIDRLIST